MKTIDLQKTLLAPNSRLKISSSVRVFNGKSSLG